MSKKLFNLDINGRDESVVAQPMASLLDVLRDGLEINSVREGCSQGGCGACTVVIDGELRLSCLTPAGTVEGKSIQTLDGMATDARIQALQEAFIEHYAAQCGFCTSGMLAAAYKLLDANPSPSRDEIVEGLSGNICRCTGYLPIIEAIQAVASMKIKAA